MASDSDRAPINKDDGKTYAQVIADAQVCLIRAYLSIHVSGPQTPIDDGVMGQALAVMEMLKIGIERRDWLLVGAAQCQMLTLYHAVAGIHASPPETWPASIPYASECPCDGCVARRAKAGGESKMKPETGDSSPKKSRKIH